MRFHLCCAAVRLHLVTAGVFVLSAAACGSDTSGSNTCDLLPGDLAISEIMSNPLGDDTNHEWFEIYNPSAQAQPLEGIIIERLTRATDGSEKLGADHKITGAGDLASHAYLTLGDAAQAPVAGTYYSYGTATDKLGELGNTSGGLRLRCGNNAVDTVWYGTGSAVVAPTEGRSASLDGGVAPDALLNDRGEYWCSGGNAYDVPGNLGTPGTTNILCGFAACNDNGSLRDVRTPGVGDLLITEVFANPTGTDTDKEWVELVATRDVDLNGVTLIDTTAAGSDHQNTVGGVACVPALLGQYVIIAATADTGVNGNVAGVDGVVSGFTLYNSAVTVALKRGQTVLDLAGLPANTPEGVSASLDPTHLNVSDNDNPANFCNSTTTNAFTGTGTPGAANDACAPSTCAAGDGCLAGCSPTPDPDCATCAAGDGCLAGCSPTADPDCGGTTCVSGGNPRAVVAPAAGDLVISEIYADPTGSDNFSDWFEVFVTAGSSKDLNGLTVVNDNNAGSGTRTWTLTDTNCIVAAPGAYVVIGGASAQGATPAATLGGSTATLLLSNTIAANYPLHLSVKAGATLIDEMTYLQAAVGRSYRLMPGNLTATANDTAANWCTASAAATYPNGSWGTPGAANNTCP